MPGVLVRAAAEVAPLALSAVVSGGADTAAGLRVWLLLRGPGSAVVQAVGASVPGSTVRAGSVPRRFSAGGDAAVRLDVEPGCPRAVDGLDRASPSTTAGARGPRTVTVPFDTGGILAATVRTRCSGLPQAERTPDGPTVRSGGPGAPGALRTVVEVGAPGPEVVVVEAVTPAAGVRVAVVTPLPGRAPVGRRRELVVDLYPRGCLSDDAPGEVAGPYLLECAAAGEVETRVDAGLRGRLLALRRSGC